MAVRQPFSIRMLASSIAISALVPSLDACGAPGIRPEGRTQAVTGSAPAGADLVFQRATLWFTTNGYVITDETNNQMLRGYHLISREGNIERRAVIEFTVARINPSLTSYHIESSTEVGSPPSMRRAETNAAETLRIMSSLDSWLSCSAAHWPGCP